MQIDCLLILWARLIVCLEQMIFYDNCFLNLEKHLNEACLDGYKSRFLQSPISRLTIQTKAKEFLIIINIKTLTFLSTF